MRHGNRVNKLGRTYAHRQALLANLAISLIEHKQIRTTLAKAKELRKYVEPLITKAKADTTHSRRVVFSYLQQKEAVSELFGVIGPKILERPGGYTRILKLGARLGDNAEMALIELVDFNEYLGGGSITEKKTTSRRRRPAKKKADAAKAQAQAEIAANTQAAVPAPEAQAGVPGGSPVSEATEAPQDDQDAGIHTDDINPSGDR